MLTQERLKELFHYDPETGIFTRLIGVGPCNKGVIFGCIETRERRRYLRGRIGGKIYYLHRLAFLYQTGRLVKSIDHINHNGLDNRWCNLREANHVINGRNARLFCTNTSGVTGVRWHSQCGKWAVYIRAGTSKYLGVYENFDEACKVRKEAERALGFHPNHGRAEA